MLNHQPTYALPPRDHLTHPHGRRVFAILEEMMAGIARAAASRGMVFDTTPTSQIRVPGRFRDSWLVWRHQAAEGVVQVPLLECLVELTGHHPERKAVRNPLNLRRVQQIQQFLYEFTDRHEPAMYSGCGLQFHELNMIIRNVIAIVDRYCLVQLSKLPEQSLLDPALRDMALLTFVLRDEVLGETDLVQSYDYQITFVWNGPDRFGRLVEQAFGICS